MTEYSKKMETCMDSLSQLSSMELIDLAEAIEKERTTRADKRCKEKILAAINAFSELYDYYNYLEIERKDSSINIYFDEISEALERLYSDC